MRELLKLMKKVLFVSYHYPPSQEVGALRPQKLVKRLTELGWRTSVLTVGKPHPNGLGGNGDIHPVQEWPHPLKVCERFHMIRARRRGQEAALLARWSEPSTDVASSPDRNAVMKRWLLPLLQVPDREIGWLIPVVWRALWLMRRQRITHLITTAPPFTSHLVGLALKRWTRVPWLADCRDPWWPEHKPALARNRLTDLIESVLVGSVMATADCVVSVTPVITERCKSEYPGLNPNKFVTIPNGFDPSDFDALPRIARPIQPIVFGYYGSFYGGRTPEPFLTALRSLLDDRTLETTDVALRMAGNVTVAEGQGVIEIVRRLKLEDVVTIESRLPREQALIRTLSSHVILVLTERQPHALPYKSFEALASGALILNLGHGGELADLLARTGRGIAVDPQEPAELRKGIMECVRRSRRIEKTREETPWRDPELQDYNFDFLARRFAAILEKLA